MNAWTRLRDLAVGTALEVGDAGRLLLGGVRSAAVATMRRGAEGTDQARRRTNAALDAAVISLATSSLVDRVVDAQLERVLRPLVRDILDDVLALLEREPDRIQTLIRGQRETMVDELVGRIRSGAAAGDTAVDRLTNRVLHREVSGE